MYRVREGLESVRYSTALSESEMPSEVADELIARSDSYRVDDERLVTDFGTFRLEDLERLA